MTIYNKGDIRYPCQLLATIANLHTIRSWFLDFNDVTAEEKVIVIKGCEKLVNADRCSNGSVSPPT